jgi:hypothetical protein
MFSLDLLLPRLDCPFAATGDAGTSFIATKLSKSTGLIVGIGGSSGEEEACRDSGGAATSEHSSESLGSAAISTGAVISTGGATEFAKDS